MPTTVILGAGIIGLSTAHSLARLASPDHTIHLVEPAPQLFSSASGKAAGFLAKDWFAPAIAPLGLLSFELHRNLANKHNGHTRWGYSESLSYSLDHAYQSDDSTPPTSGASTSPPVSSALAFENTPSSSLGNNAPALAPTSNASTYTDSAASSMSSLGPDSASAGDLDVAHEQPSGRNGSQGQGGLDWLLSNTSRVTVAGTADSSYKTQSADDLPPWLLAQPGALEAISDRRSTAQVIPRKLCEFLLEQCLAAGVTLHHPARATKFVRDEGDPDGLTRLRIGYSAQSKSQSPVDLPCETVVIAAGCWTPQVYATLFPNASRMPRITHLAGYSVTLKSKHWPRTAIPSGSDPDPVEERDTTKLAPEPSASTDPALPGPDGPVRPCYAVFTDTTGFAPEMFSRANGDVWLGGLNPPYASLPKLPSDAYVDPAEVNRLLAVGHELCGADVEMTGQALCFRPVSATGRPIIARMHEADLGDGLKPMGLDGKGGVFVATGHGPWGIALSLGTGQVMAEMVLGRETSANVEQLSRW
uniref:Vacuolar protein sorting-associated protein 17 n=1 Tax=Ganoderma boninense TaxID=34458 RepID=A0A5K1K4Y3_9APHY|nr:Vacuolar protein sorting-associated protein 17 [Ganoderma boninense]